MAVPAKLVKELRDRTGLGMMDCKAALEGAGGVIETAIEQLRKNSALKAAKKAGRAAAEGVLGLKVAEDGSRAALVEVNIETDFAARNEKFTDFDRWRPRQGFCGGWRYRVGGERIRGSA